MRLSLLATAASFLAQTLTGPILRAQPSGTTNYPEMNGCLQFATRSGAWNGRFWVKTANAHLLSLLRKGG